MATELWHSQPSLSDLGVEVILERDDGILEARVPKTSIDSGNIPIDKDHAAKMLKRMIEFQKDNNGKGNGQEAPIALGYPTDATLLYLYDGAHRYDGLLKRPEVDRALAIINVGCSWEYIFENQIGASKVDKLHLPRFGELFAKAYQFAPCRGFVSTAQEAFALYFGEEDELLRERISEEQRRIVSDYIESKLPVWSQDARAIYRCLTAVKGILPEIARQSRGGQRGGGRHKTYLTSGDLTLLGRVEGSRQKIAAEAILEQGVRGEPKVRQLVTAIDQARTEEAARELVTTKAWEKPIESTNEYQIREAKIQELTQLVIERGLEFATAELARQRLSVVLNPNSPETFFLTEGGPAAQAFRNRISDQERVKRPPAIAGASERILLTKDFRNIHELQDSVTERHLSAARLLEKLGFQVDYSDFTDLYIKNEGSGNYRVTIAHPTEPLIARCFGTIDSSKTFSIDSVYILFAEGYKPPVVKPKPLPEHTPTPPIPITRTKKIPASELPAAPKIVSDPPVSEIIIPSVLREEEDPGPEDDEEISEPQAEDLAAVIAEAAQADYFTDPLNGRGGHETHRAPYTQPKEPDSAKEAVIARVIAQAQTQSQTKIEFPSLTPDDLKPYRRFVPKNPKPHQAIVPIVIRRINKDDQLVSISNEDNPGGERKIPIINFLQDYEKF
jgi:hypothetical protein